MGFTRILSLAVAALITATAVPLGAFTSVKAEETPLPYMDTSLSFEERAADLVSRMTLAEKVAQTGRTAPAIDRLGVHSYNYWSEGLHGVARQGKATSFPTSLSLSNTWDRELMREVMDITSTEARGKNNRYNLSYWNPTINMARDPRWGRNEESYGEDPYLTSELGIAAIEGMQGNDSKYKKTMATLKHYAANNCEGERQSGTSVMSESALRDYYTKAFGNITEKADPQSVMSSYNAISMSRNGVLITDYIASSANKYLLTDVLRRTYGFGGYVVGDCGAWENLYGTQSLRSKLFPDLSLDQITAPMAVSKAYNAGNNLDCGARAQSSGVASVEEGWTDEGTLDRAVYELMLARMKTGEFDNGAKYQNISSAVLETEEHVAKAREAAEESLVLLENKNDTLPLKSDTKKIAIVGSMANKLVLGDYTGSPTDNTTPIEGIRTELSKLNPNIEVQYLGEVTNDELLFNVKSIKLVKKDGTKANIDLSTAESVSGMSLADGQFKDITPAARAVIKNVNFPNVASVEVEMATGSRIGGGLNISYGQGGPTVATVNSIATADINTYTACAGAYTGEDGGYNGTADMYISANATIKNFSIEAYKTQLDAADYIIAYGATIPKQDGLGDVDASESHDRSSIDLPAHESHIQSIAQAYPDKTIIVMSTVGQINVEPFKDKCAAMLWTSYNGQKQGSALGKVLTGEVNPSGHLTTTWYSASDLNRMPLGSTREQDANKIYRNYTDYNINQHDNIPGRTYQYYNGTPVYPFGYGQSYTTFGYSNIKVKGEQTPDNNTKMTYAIGKVSIETDRDRVTLIRGRYTDGVLDSVKINTIQTENGTSTFTTDALAGDKLMLWDSLEGMKPLCDTITVPPSGDITVLSQDEPSDITATDGVNANDILTITADVTNTGNAAGTEVAQLYVTVPGADGVRLPLKQLKGFERVELKPNETKTVTFTLDMSDNCFFDETTQKNYVPTGEYTIAVGPNADSLDLSARINVEGAIEKTVKTVKAIPTGIKLYAARKSDGTVSPANTISADASVSLKDEELIFAKDYDNITYTSSNPAVATVDNEGNVQSGGTAGTALITVSAGGKSDAFAVVTEEITAASDSDKAPYLEEIENTYNTYPREAYTAENYARLTQIYNSVKSDINQELLVQNLAKLTDNAVSSMKAIEKIELTDKYTITSDDLHYGVINKNSVQLSVKDNVSGVDMSNITWVIEKQDNSKRSAPTIDENGLLTVTENGAFKVTAYNYSENATGSTVIYANIPIEGERADDGDGANLGAVNETASGGKCASNTSSSWIRFDGVKLRKLTAISARVSKASGDTTVNASLSNGKDFKGNALNSGSERIIASAPVTATGSDATWSDIRLTVDRNEISKLNLDNNGCGSIYIQTNGANLDNISLEYINSDMDVLNMTGGKVKVSVPFNSGVIAETKGTGADAVVTKKTVTAKGDYIFENHTEGDILHYELTAGGEDATPLTAAVDSTYNAPQIKELTIFDFADPAFNSFFETAEGDILSSGTGMDGIGGWLTQEKRRTVTYKGKTYTFNRGLKAGSGSKDKSNVHFTPEADGLVTALLDTNTERKLIIEQGENKGEGYGTGTDILATVQLYVRAGEPVYIYGGGSNKQFYGVIFDTDYEYSEPTPAPSAEPMPEIVSTTKVEAENFVAGWFKNDLSKVKNDTFIENTKNNDILYLGEYNMTNLAGIDVVAGTRESGNKLEFFAVDTTDVNVGTATKEAVTVLLTSQNSLGSVTIKNTGGWNTMVTDTNIVRVTNAPSATKGLFAILTTDGSYCGNYDYFNLLYGAGE